MSTIKNLYYKIKHGLPDKIKRLRFDATAKKVLSTPRIRSKQDGLVILSMVSHQDVLMYLLAMKSLSYYLQRGRFEVINDGSLTDKDTEMITDHISGVKFTDFSKINNTKCPKKGVWERLLYAAQLSEKEQVLVVDSDILTSGPVPELIGSIEQNHSCIIGVKSGKGIEPMRVVWEEERERHGNIDMSKSIIQTYFDAHLNLIPEIDSLKYLKATNGFNGFARGVISRDLVEEWSMRMEAVFHERWHEWGTEQITACLLVSNFGKTDVLTEPGYGLYYAFPSVDYDKFSIIHFIGSHRFKEDYYRNKVLKFITSVPTLHR